ncbi:hypothetical protein B7Z00_00095 [Candidatus Saccharibacteria bacterium 32-50-10]|nr:MAG: hypothetical protein B7Z00_00095 [Candidatus Saccharibacteria bacterium 32-50-10]
MANQQKKGFSIIEVVLVLAIAGLIFLMVFIALPALQRGQRDSARKNDASIVASALNSYKSSNRGSFTGITAGRLQQYVDRLDQYEVTSISQAGNNTINGVTNSNVYYRVGAKCPTTTPAPGVANITLAGATARQAAVVLLLENNGSQSQIYCVDV